MIIYITAPLNNKQPKKSSAAPSPRVASTSRVVASCRTHLFVWSSVCLFLWLGVSLSLCPLSSCPVPSHRRTTSFRYISSLVVRLVVVELSRRCVSSRLVDVSRPLTHLVSPALFDCCVVVLHLVVTVQPQPPLQLPCPCRRRRRAVLCRAAAAPAPPPCS